MVVTTSPALAQKSWIVVGASRGIGLEFVRQLLEQEKQVIAVVRDPANASQLWQYAAGPARPGGCVIEQCDVTSEKAIDAFAVRIKRLVDNGLLIEGVILNAGVLDYPNRAIEITHASLTHHLSTNTIGPITIAQRLLNTHTFSPPLQTPKLSSCALPPNKIIFLSSDSGSMIHFRDFEDGFAAYAASKAALNMMARHLAVELKRRGGIWADITLLCLHPGEVSTDMGAIEVGWEVEGIISAQESVQGMLKVISSKGKEDSGGFWCWDGREHPW